MIVNSKKIIVEVCKLLETLDIYPEYKEYIDHIYFLVSETSIDKEKIALHYFPKTRKMLGCKKFVLDLDKMQYQELKKKDKKSVLIPLMDNINYERGENLFSQLE